MGILPPKKRIFGHPAENEHFGYQQKRYPNFVCFFRKTTKIAPFLKVPELRTLHGIFDPQKEDFWIPTRNRPIWGIHKMQGRILFKMLLDFYKRKFDEGVC